MSVSESDVRSGWLPLAPFVFCSIFLVLPSRMWPCLLISGAQGAVAWKAASVPLENLLEMQIPGPCP